jgi:hypothetical protein
MPGGFQLRGPNNEHTDASCNTDKSRTAAQSHLQVCTLTKARRVWNLPGALLYRLQDNQVGRGGKRGQVLARPLHSLTEICL